MERLYLLKKIDGSVSIMSILDNNTDIEIELLKRDINYRNSIISYTRITREQIPIDRTFRDAWNHNLSVDMTKARNIHLNRLREIRNKKLAESDIELLKAQENNNNQKITELKKYRQRLRDMPNLVNQSLINADTPEKLKLVNIPELL